MLSNTVSIVMTITITVAIYTGIVITVSMRGYCYKSVYVAISASSGLLAY